MTIEAIREPQDRLSPSVSVVPMVDAWAVNPTPDAGGRLSRLRPVVGVMQATASQATTLTVSEMVQSLREAGLPISAIAEAARVERKTVYSWLDGVADPRGEHAARVAQVYRVLLPAGFRDLRDLYRMWSTPLADGATLKTLLAALPFDEPAVREVAKSLWPKARAAMARRRRMVAPDGANGFVEDLEVTADL